MATTITFDFGAYGGRPTLDETEQDTESLDFGAYAGRPSVYPQGGAPPAGGISKLAGDGGGLVGPYRRLVG